MSIGHSTTPPRPWLRPALHLLLLAASLLFIIRGPVAAVRTGGNYDFTLIYSSSRAWVEGLNPYLASNVSKAWLSSHGPADLDPTLVRGSATLVYPLPALVILSPIAALPWPIATWVWALLNTALVALSLHLLAQLANLSGNARLLFYSLGLVLGPLALNIKQGQTAGLVVAGIVLASSLLRRSTFSGPCLGLAAALKPQLGALFLIYHAGRLRWKHTLFAIAAIAALTALGAARLSLTNTDWFTSWQTNVRDFTTLDDANATRSNPIRYQMVNLHFPLHNITDNRDAVRLAVYGICGTLCLTFFIADLKRARQTTDTPAELTSLSFVSAITLIVAYHRPYDAAILVIPLALAVSRLAAGARHHLITLALILLHALPLPILFTEAARRGYIPQSLLDSAIGQHLLLPCQAYGLVALAAWLIYTRWKDAEPLTRKST